jgi:hypothetical protein
MWFPLLLVMSRHLKPCPLYRRTERFGAGSEMSANDKRKLARAGKLSAPRKFRVGRYFFGECCCLSRLVGYGRSMSLNVPCVTYGSAKFVATRLRLPFLTRRQHKVAQIHRRKSSTAISARRIGSRSPRPMWRITINANLCRARSLSLNFFGRQLIALSNAVAMIFKVTGS